VPAVTISPRHVIFFGYLVAVNKDRYREIQTSSNFNKSTLCLTSAHSRQMFAIAYEEENLTFLFCWKIRG
jgi:hypothetical protein